MKPRGKRKALVLAIAFGALWVTVLVLQASVFSGWLSTLSLPQRLAVDAVVAIPLLYWAAQYLAWYWRGGPERRYTDTDGF